MSNWGYTFGIGMSVSLLHSVETGCGCPSSFLSNGVWALSPRIKGKTVKLAIHLQLILRLRTRATISPF
jgi:hypothetical protein